LPVACRLRQGFEGPGNDKIRSSKQRIGVFTPVDIDGRDIHNRNVRRPAAVKIPNACHRQAKTGTACTDALQVCVLVHVQHLTHFNVIDVPAFVT
jgi:hypothetical protein